jgi:hypothetical protein
MKMKAVARWQNWIFATIAASSISLEATETVRAAESARSM